MQLQPHWEEFSTQMPSRAPRPASAAWASSALIVPPERSDRRPVPEIVSYVQIKAWGEGKGIHTLSFSSLDSQGTVIQNHATTLEGFLGIFYLLHKGCRVSIRVEQ